MTPLIEHQLEQFFRRHPPPEAVADVGCGDDHSALKALVRAGIPGHVDRYDLPFDICEGPLPLPYSTIVCNDALEHIPQPFDAAANIVKSLAGGGWLYVTTVFAFEKHEYPRDYWRFTDTALEMLFADLVVEDCWFAEETSHPDMLTRRRVSLVGQRPA